MIQPALPTSRGWRVESVSLRFWGGRQSIAPVEVRSTPRPPVAGRISESQHGQSNSPTLARLCHTNYEWPPFNMEAGTVHSIRQVLEAVHAEGTYSWPENIPCPLGPMAEEACHAGYLRRTDDGAAGAFEFYQLTRLGREYLDLPPTIMDRIFYAFQSIMPSPS